MQPSFDHDDMLMKPYLEHHGILGMKWGIRRYQNPDGTLTEAGKKRYGTRLKEMEGKALNPNGSVKDKKAYDKYIKELDKAVNEIGGTKVFDAMNPGVRKENAKKYGLDDKNKTSEQTPPKTVKEAVSRDPVMAKVEKDHWSQYNADGLPRNDKHSHDIADLGIKALLKAGRYVNDFDANNITKTDREWFLYEDQTWGLPLAAHLITKGHSAKDVKKYFKAISDVPEPNDDDFRKYFAVYQADYNYDSAKIDDFIDACASILGEKKHK